MDRAEDEPVIGTAEKASAEMSLALAFPQRVKGAKDFAPLTYAVRSRAFSKKCAFVVFPQLVKARPFSVVPTPVVPWCALNS